MARMTRRALWGTLPCAAPRICAELPSRHDPSSPNLKIKNAHNCRMVTMALEPAGLFRLHDDRGIEVPLGDIQPICVFLGHVLKQSQPMSRVGRFK